MTSSISLDVTCNDVNLCSFTAWYPHFSSHAYKCVTITAPPELHAYLNSDDGVHLADSNDVVARDTHVDEAQDYDDEGWDAALNEPDTVSQIQVPDEFRRALSDALRQLGGECFLKLNWSAPRDAAWILGAHGSELKFSSVDQMLVALKSSDFIMHDIEHRYEHCVDANSASSSLPLCVVLKPWKALRRDGEFRCFVYRRTLIAACQRHSDEFFPFLRNDTAQLTATLRDFFSAHVTTNTAFALESFVCDVYVTSKGVVRMLDVAPFGVMTDAVLFSWQEIAARCSQPSADNELLRIVDTQQGIRPSLKSVAGLPYDLTLGAVEACADVDALVDQLRDHIDKRA